MFIRSTKCITGSARRWWRRGRDKCYSDPRGQSSWRGLEGQRWCIGPLLPYGCTLGGRHKTWLSGICLEYSSHSRQPLMRKKKVPAFSQNSRLAPPSLSWLLGIGGRDLWACRWPIGFVWPMGIELISGQWRVYLGFQEWYSPGMARETSPLLSREAACMRDGAQLTHAWAVMESEPRKGGSRP